MANNHSTLTGLFTDIADAIRAKTGGTEPIVADQFPEAIAAAGGAPLVGAITVADNTTTVEIPVDKMYSHLIMFAVTLTAIDVQSLGDEFSSTFMGHQTSAMTKEVLINANYCGGSYAMSSSGSGKYVQALISDPSAVGLSPITFTESKITVSVLSQSMPGTSKFAPGNYCYIAW